MKKCIILYSESVMLLPFPVLAVSHGEKHEFICSNVVVVSAHCTKEVLGI